MSAVDPEDELVAEPAEGYVVGQKKTVEEYVSLDNNDESLRKWKESLGLTSDATTGSIGEPGDKRKVVILKLELEFRDHPTISVDLSAKSALEALKNKPLVIKEGSRYKVRIRFRVQHEIITGLRYLQLVKRKGIKVDKSDEVCGSYSPNTEQKPYYEKTFLEEEAPSGMLARGTYDMTSKFVDDDNTTHLLFTWQLSIKKSWD
ncbi:rho guanidine dissociation inhibitor [Myxozyma melibiosi]|uniref:Rho guanidine dissociation inhibitor n=1 Tax=Myxozyma melibiosi TaxID=54550 RepID=A0ABR1FCS7_9ASCO